MPSILLQGAQKKRPKTKRPKGQHVPRDNTSHDKRSQGKNTPRDKTSQRKNVPRDKTSQGRQRPTLITKFSKTNFVLENWPHMLGNGPQFMIGVFLFWKVRLGNSFILAIFDKLIGHICTVQFVQYSMLGNELWLGYSYYGEARLGHSFILI